VANTLYVKRAIADYIIETLGGANGLDGIRVFIRGALPSGMIPQDKYPFCEVIVAEEVEEEEMTGNYYQQAYTGIITVTILLTQLAGGDWLEIIGERCARVPSYDLVEEYVYAMMAELQKSDHKSLGNLTMNDEAVTHFSIVGPRVYGLDQGARANSWENFGSIPFEVRTQRRRD